MRPHSVTSPLSEVDLTLKAADLSRPSQRFGRKSIDLVANFQFAQLRPPLRLTPPQLRDLKVPASTDVVAFVATRSHKFPSKTWSQGKALVANILFAQLRPPLRAARLS